MTNITTPPTVPDPRTLSKDDFEISVAGFLAYIPVLVADINEFIVWASNLAQSITNQIDTLSTMLSTVNVVAGNLLVRASNTTLVAGDNAKTIKCTAAFTQSLTAAATLGNGWFVNVHNDSNGSIVYDPAGSELIAGNSTYTIMAGMKVTVYCDGVGFNVSQQAGSASQNNIDIALRKARNAQFY